MSESSVERLEEIKKELPSNLHPLLIQADGGARLAAELPTLLSPQDCAVEGSKGALLWERCGLLFTSLSRYYEALGIFSSLYKQMLTFQEMANTRVHKGMPLVWISECHRHLGHPVLAKRYLLLTACEDGIRDHGQILPQYGVYFRGVWMYGLPERLLSRYALAAWQRSQTNPVEARFPEWILQDLDHDWMTEFPSASESTLFVVNEQYVKWLIDRLGSSSGRELERLAHYLLTSIPGCRAYRSVRAESTEYDVVCAVEGPSHDFRSELGRYFLCECKDWSKPADYTVFAKFCRVLDSAKSRFGILFSKHGITGSDTMKDATREQLKVFQDRGIVVIVVNEADLKDLAAGLNLITMLRSRYERVRLDIVGDLT